MAYSYHIRYRSLVHRFGSLLRRYRSLLQRYGSLLQRYPSLLQMYNSDMNIWREHIILCMLCICKYVCVCVCVCVCVRARGAPRSRTHTHTHTHIHISPHWVVARASLQLDTVIECICYWRMYMMLLILCIYPCDAKILSSPSSSMLMQFLQFVCVYINVVLLNMYNMSI